MAKDWAKKFYQSKSWINMRDYMMRKHHFLCQRCKSRPAEIVHHIIWLNPSNINDVEISLGEKNLIPVCRECHAIIHEGTQPTVEGLKFNEYGELIKDEDIYSS